MSHFIKKHLYLIALMLSVLCFALNFYQWNGNYTDSDGYMRALRMKHWISNMIFWEQIIPESNYPYGEINHWTRPMDILWLMCYLPFRAFLPLKDAIFMGGAFISPLIKIATAMILIYGFKRYFNVYLILFGLLLFLNYPTGIFEAGRPDHHALMNLWLMSSLSLAMCWLKKKKNKHLIWLGIVLALSVFTAIEGILLYALVLMFFIYLYTFNNNSLVPACLISKSFSITLTICWLLNPPYQGWFYPDNGRISILFVCLSWLIYGSFLINKKTTISKPIHKIRALLTTAIVCVFTLISLFGTNIFSTPLTPEITEVWAKHINEMYPIYKQKWFVQSYNYGFSSCAIALNIFLLHKNIHKQLMLLNLCVGLPLFILSLYATRFTNYSCIFCILPFIAFTEYLYTRFPNKLNLKEDMPFYVWAVLGAFLIQTFFALPLSLCAKMEKTQKTFSYALCQNVRNIGGTLVTNTFQGPKYVWRCNVNTVATPYHRNIDGILDNRHILAGTNDNEIIPLLLKHQVTQIVVFEKYQLEFDEKDETLLFNRLIKRQNIPAYLEEIPACLDTARHYRVKI